jgi:hypothetical protein
VRRRRRAPVVIQQVWSASLPVSQIAKIAGDVYDKPSEQGDP